MRTFEQVKDVIRHSKGSHRELRKYFELLKRKCGAERSIMMLDFLISTQRKSEEALARFELESEPSVLESWMQYVPSINIHELLKDHQDRPEFSFDEIVKVADNFGEAMIGFYKEAANEAEIQKVRALFENLLELEKKDTIKQMRASSIDYM